MNEGDSAGGGQHGLNPASPAVTDRRSTQQIANTSLSNTSSNNSSSSVETTQENSSQQRQQTTPSGSAVSTATTLTPVSTQSQTTRNILVVTPVPQPMTITQQTRDSNSSSVSVPSRSSSSYSPSSAVPTNAVVNNPTHSQVKRFKLDLGVPDITALKKRILDHKLARIRIIKEKHSENVVELYFLSIGGNMMDYPTWKKKPLPQQFNNFSKVYRLGALSNTESQKLISLQQPSLNSANLPEGAEVKISGVGVTPVAVSKTLPASVVQLTQQGGKPLVPDIHNTISSASENLTSTSPTATTSNHITNSALATTISTLSNGNPNDVTVKAKQEVYVLQRISELQREGLWTEKRLPKLQEPQRPKAHWDYLLEEMVWLAADFAQERKWKKNAAKKCSRMVQKYFQDKANAAQKAEKAQELHLKRVAAFIAREVKIFWSNVEKIVEYKHTTKLEEKRKKALDQHLNFIVDQTEKFSQQLVEGMNKTVATADNSAAASLNSSRISSPRRAAGSDDEFRPGESSQDDEETIAKAEEENISDVKDEIAALQRESQMDFDDFLNDLPKDYLANRGRLIQQEGHSTLQSDEDDDEFEANESSDDNEDTIMEEENATGDNVDHKQEIEELNADAEMSIDDLIAKYNVKQPPNLSVTQGSTSRRRSTRLAPVNEPPPSMKLDSDDDSDSANESEEASDVDDEFLTADEETLENSADKTGLRSLLDNDNGKGDDLLNDAAALAESIQPKGNTLSSTNVVTPVPFLLKHSLREYQHIGLDWLVTMCDRKLNGILADEMGLGKTIQTIALLAHLACEKNNWGPHLIVVPSSVMLNWEMEFKKWCPGFKIMTYYGNQKERKLKRVGWTKPNAFHICITSYKLIVQDQQSFRRKKWKYLILDEAQNIKNFKSQRWQLLLNFSTEQRLLLTGTPLQNNLMELWSLMHFLMPHVFQSHREFKEWFSNPVTGMIEGNAEYNESIIKRLHKVLRPFLLRRLKSEVEKQMPQKYEHVVMCRLSKRQRYLYDDFMGRAKTKETLNSGNLLSVINVLMQLRKVCNHPNLFETRPTVSPFQMEGLSIKAPSLVCNIFKYDPFNQIDLNSLNLLLIEIELTLTAYVSYKSRRLQAPKKLIEEIDTSTHLTPECPKGDFKFYIRVKDTKTAETMNNHFNCVKIGTSPAMKTEGNKLVPAVNLVENNRNSRLANINPSTKTVIAENDKLVNALAHELKSPVDVKMDTDENCNNTEKVSKESELEFGFNSYTEQRKNERLQNLISQARINRRRSNAIPIYGSDCRESIENFLNPVRKIEHSTWSTRSFSNCRRAQLNGHNWALEKAIKTYEERTIGLSDIFDNFILFVPSVLAPQPYLHVQHLEPSKAIQENSRDKMLRYYLSPKLTLLHPIISQMSTKFPDPRLIQYDCGKLQTLDRLLKRLKDEQHRVLIFTQMTKMLDVLEAFLNYHGHIYLRLDGSTKVDQRQILMERFNGDKRIFVFILSTRSGGVGVNLTGADTVIFYDSDWNPTMDAQAQDRCHRIGQTRDVHIYRLISEKTIEENILKKANQKRMLGDLAIEGGNFTTAFFKTTTIQGLFEVQQGNDASTRLADVVETRSTATTSVEKIQNEKTSISTFENALAEAEDDLDVEAAKVAVAEAAADLDEFDENIPLEETEKPEMSKIDQEMEQIVSQLSPIERYALNFVEATGDAWTAESLRLAEAEIEAQKKEWEANRLAAIQKQEEELQKIEQLENDGGDEYESDDEILTYSREDAMNQMWISTNSFEQMPLWCPPTPPQNENDIYIDYSLLFLYEQETMVESQLPPIYIKRDYKRIRTDIGYGFYDGRRPPKIRKDESYYAPRSLFDRPSAAIAKMRRELKSQRYRGMFKPNIQVPGLKQQLNQKAINEPEGTPEWGVFEEVAILHCLQNLQGLPLNLMLLSPGHTPNWDLVAETVNLYSKTYRPPVHCRWKFHTHIVPREEGKLTDSPKKQKKLKFSSKPNLKGGIKMLKSSQHFSSDNNASYTKLMKARFDAIKAAYLQKAPPPKRKFSTPSSMNLKHAEVLCSFGITSYDAPMSPTTIAIRKAEKLREKHHHHHQQQCSNSTQSIPVQQSASATSIVVQQSSSPQVSQILQRSQSTSSNSSGGTPSSNNIQVHHQAGQIVKAIVAPSQQAQQIQLQQTSSNSQIVPSSVSVVLTTPVSTMSTQGNAQILSLQAQQGQTTSSSTSIVQTVPTTQVVSVSQLTSVGTVLTTSSALQSTGTTLNASALRTQRIVTTPGSIQEVVLQQRPNAQSPTIVSMSSLGQTVPVQQQQQFQQFKLTVAANPLATTSGVVTTKGLQQTNKISTTQPTTQILYRQQPARSQIKILQAQPGQTLVNTSGAINIVPATTQTMQVQGQKVAVATVSAAPGSVGQPTQSIVTSVATVQVAPGQARPQFIKQVGTKVGRVDNEMLLVKRQVLTTTGQHKQQLIPQTQIFTPTNIQVQQQAQQQSTQVSSSGSTQVNVGQQQIATIVKTAGNTSNLASGSGMISQIKPSGQIKVTMGNQTQMRGLQLQPQPAMYQRKVGGAVTVQQIQQVIRHAAPGTLQAGGQIVLGKTRVIPVSLASQPTRQAIQVVSTGPNQTISASNLRTHVATGQNVSGTIKVASANSAQLQNLQQQNQQGQTQQRQNSSPVRIQTSGGNLVTVAVQQLLPQTTTGQSVDIQNIQQQPASQSNISQQQTTQQQVRTLVKKKLMQNRYEKKLD